MGENGHENVDPGSTDTAPHHLANGQVHDWPGRKRRAELGSLCIRPVDLASFGAKQHERKPYALYSLCLLFRPQHKEGKAKGEKWRMTSGAGIGERQLANPETGVCV